MNNRFKELLKTLLRFFPPALVILMLGFFAYFSWHYKLIADDFEFQNILKGRSVFEASLVFYKNFNGRFASHFFLCSLFKLFSNNENLFFFYRFLMLFGFIFSLAHFLRNYLDVFRAKILSERESIFWSAFITAFLFFFYFAGRLELWFWISATGVYLASLIIGLNAFALILNKNQNWKTNSVSFLLFFLAGSFSESFAVMYFLLLIYLEYKVSKKWSFIRPHLKTIRTGIFALMLSLISALCSAGIHNRLGNLPHFGFFYAFKNTLHSLAFSVLRYKHLPFEILLVLVLFFYAHFYFPKENIGIKHFIKKGLAVLLFISISFYIPCYLLSDIVPDRAASLGYLAGVLFLFDYFIFSAASFHTDKKG
jgi:hypothetical protein